MAAKPTKQQQQKYINKQIFMIFDILMFTENFQKWNQSFENKALLYPLKVKIKLVIIVLFLILGHNQWFLGRIPNPAIRNHF